jgi:hypothetical protein
MAATISLPNIEFSGHFQTPAKVGAKTIMLNVNYVGCNVSIARTNERYYSITARRNLRDMATTVVTVWFDRDRGVWVGDYFEHGYGTTTIGQSTDLAEMLSAAMNNVSWRGHETSQW